MENRVHRAITSMQCLTARKPSLPPLPNFYQGPGWDKRFLPPNHDLYCFKLFSFPLESLFRFRICTILSNFAKKKKQSLMLVWPVHKNLFHWNKDLNLWLKMSLQWGTDYQEDQNILLLEKCSPGLPELYMVVLTACLVACRQYRLSVTQVKKYTYFIIKKKSGCVHVYVWYVYPHMHIPAWTQTSFWLLSTKEISGTTRNHKKKHKGWKGSKDTLKPVCLK